MAEGNSNPSASFMDNFSCRICLEFLDDPVQCQNNEHYFCRKCITKHLHDNTETCPLCGDQLTIKTLRQPSRIVATVVSQVKKPRCSYVSRGCTENVKVEELLLHEQACGYAPVVCSNEGCKETVNRRDKESHETQECKFRMITCESCAEEMTNHDYEKHQCTFRREINEIKVQLVDLTVTLNKMAATQTQILGKLKTCDESIKNLQDPLRRASCSAVQREGSVVVNGQIFIFGGTGEDGETSKSLEVFNWSTKTWTLMKDCLFFDRSHSFSFHYGMRLMVCGGCSSNRIEFLNQSKTGFTSSMFPGNLPDQGVVNAVPFGNRLITFGAEVQETLLESPWETRTLLEKNLTYTCRCGVERFGNDIFIVRGSNVQRYDTVRNDLTVLPSLPYTVSGMATVAYKDDIIILGGDDDSLNALNDVLMYNIHSLECKRLPSMLQKRSGCAAVIMGDVIVVMGGVDYDFFDVTYLNSVEYYVIGESTWQELPAMNLARTNATACVCLN